MLPDQKSSASGQAPVATTASPATPPSVNPVPPAPKPPVVPSPSPVPTAPPASGAAASLPLREPAAIDISRFNALVGDWKGQPVEDLKRLFTKQVILDDTTTINVETI